MYRLLLFTTVLFASTHKSSKVAAQSPSDHGSLFGQSLENIPPAALDFICDSLCEDEDEGSGDAIIMETLSSIVQQLGLVQTQLDRISSKISSTAGGSAETLRPEWKKKYPVYMVESPYGHYQLTKSEASKMCEESGGRLATLNQLQAAFEAGMDWCSCGWLEDGFAAYPIQWPRDGCLKTAPPGVRQHCTWQSTWNGWCINGDYWS